VMPSREALQQPAYMSRESLELTLYLMVADRQKAQQQGAPDSVIQEMNRRIQRIEDTLNTVKGGQDG